MLGTARRRSRVPCEVLPPTERGSDPALDPSTERLIRFVAEKNFYGEAGAFLRAFLEQGALYCARCRDEQLKGMLVPCQAGTGPLWQCRDCDVSVPEGRLMLGCLRFGHPWRICRECQGRRVSEYVAAHPELGRRAASRSRSR